MPSDLVQELDLADQQHESVLRKNGWWASKAVEPVRQTLGAKLMFDKMTARQPGQVD